jgi:hypothetical protein
MVVVYRAHPQDKRNNGLPVWLWLTPRAFHGTTVLCILPETHVSSSSSNEWTNRCEQRDTNELYVSVSMYIRYRWKEERQWARNKTTMACDNILQWQFVNVGMSDRVQCSIYFPISVKRMNPSVWAFCRHHGEMASIAVRDRLMTRAAVLAVGRPTPRTAKNRICSYGEAQCGNRWRHVIMSTAWFLRDVSIPARKHSTAWA